jgi:hypothetical protein
MLVLLFLLPKLLVSQHEDYEAFPKSKRASSKEMLAHPKISPYGRYN